MTFADIASYFSGLDEQKRCGAITSEEHKRRSRDFIENLYVFCRSSLDTRAIRLIESRRS
jgi:hypothetical protein